MKQTITLFESQLHSRSWQKLSVRILNVYLYLTLCVRSESNVTRHVVCGLSMCCYLTHRSKCMYTSQAVHLNKTKALGVNVSQLSLSQRTKGRRRVTPHCHGERWQQLPSTPTLLDRISLSALHTKFKLMLHSNGEKYSWDQILLPGRQNTDSSSPGFLIAGFRLSWLLHKENKYISIRRRKWMK